MEKLDFCKNNIRIKLVETAEELQQARKLRYDELILFHRNAKDVRFEDSYDSWDVDCDNLIAVDINTNQVVGCYRLIARRHYQKIGRFAMESNFNVDDIKNQPYEILELGRAAVKEGYRDGFVIKMLFTGLFKYIKQNGIKLLFGVISLPEMSQKTFDNLMSYFYTMVSTDPTLQPFAKEPSFKLDILPTDQIDMADAKRNVPPILKAYIGMGCRFAPVGSMQNKLLCSKDVLIMLDIDKINQRYLDLVTR